MYSHSMIEINLYYWWIPLVFHRFDCEIYANLIWWIFSSSSTYLPSSITATIKLDRVIWTVWWIILWCIVDDTYNGHIYILFFFRNMCFLEILNKKALISSHNYYNFYNLMSYQAWFLINYLWNLSITSI